MQHQKRSSSTSSSSLHPSSAAWVPGADDKGVVPGRQHVYVGETRRVGRRWLPGHGSEEDREAGSRGRVSEVRYGGMDPGPTCRRRMWGWVSPADWSKYSGTGETHGDNLPRGAGADRPTDLVPRNPGKGTGTRSVTSVRSLVIRTTDTLVSVATPVAPKDPSRPRDCP